MEEDIIKFNERKKILTHRVSNLKPIYGNNKYGNAQSTTDAILTEEGIKYAIGILEEQKKTLEKDVDKAKKQFEEHQENLKKVKKDIHRIKNVVGSRINFKKCKDTKKSQDGSKKPTEKQSNTSVNSVEDMKKKPDN